MGAWGVRSFENDDALDLVSDFEEAGWSSIRAALEDWQGSTYVETQAACRAIAAAEIVAIQLGHAGKSVPAIEFPDGNPDQPELLGLRETAVMTLARLGDSSELRELWHEAGQLEEWVGDIKELSRRLEAPPKGAGSRRTTQRRPRLVEGTGYAIPLPSGGFAIGLLTHLIAGKLPFGYFFGPRRNPPPSYQDLLALKPEAALLRVKFGRTEIDNGRWSPVGTLPVWSPVAWPTPSHTSGLAGQGMVWRVDYDRTAEKDKGGKLTRVAEKDAVGLPTDTVFGALALEKRLDREL